MPHTEDDLCKVVWACFGSDFQKLWRRVYDGNWISASIAEKATLSKARGASSSPWKPSHTFFYPRKSFWGLSGFAQCLLFFSKSCLVEGNVNKAVLREGLAVIYVRADSTNHVLFMNISDKRWFCWYQTDTIRLFSQNSQWEQQSGRWGGVRLCNSNKETRDSFHKRP